MDATSTPSRQQLAFPLGDPIPMRPVGANQNDTISPLSKQRKWSNRIENNDDILEATCYVENVNLKEPKGNEKEKDRKLTIPEEADKSWVSYLKMSNSIISDTFSGQFQSTIECLTCKNRSSSFDPYFDICVPIPDSENAEQRL